MTDTLSAQTPVTSASAGVPVTAPVTAVVVTAGVTRYLPTTLAALANQTRRPARVLLVNVGGPDGVAEVFDATFAAAGGPSPRLARTSAPWARSFGRAVGAGLATMDEALAEAPTPWVWLLHDDSAPAPDALAELVRAVGHSPSVALAGAKQRTWTDPERLLEVGIRTTRWGRRMSDVEPGELDQGQLDGRSDVLAVGLAGALVRRDVWDALRGPDPALGEFGAGLDLSRRARLAGHRVIVVPGAVVRHAQARYQGLRGRDVADEDLDGDGEADAGDPRRSFAERRRSVVHARLVAAPLPLLPVVAVVAVLAGLVRAALEIAVKQPSLAAAELRGVLAAFSRPDLLVRARRRAAATARVPRRTLWPLQATWRDVWTQAQDRRLARAEARKIQRAPSELEINELAALATRRRVTLGLLVAALVTASLVGFAPLVGQVLGGSRLVGGALAHASSSLGDLWAAATSGWVRGGLGEPGPADPLLLALTPLAALLGGSLAAAVNVLMLGSVLLAGLGAWAAAGAATRSAGVRAWAALVWAAAPALLLAAGSGRLGAVVAHAALPWVALGLVRAVGIQRVDQVLSGLVTAVPKDAEPADRVAELAESAGGSDETGERADDAASGSEERAMHPAPAGIVPTQRPAATPPRGVARLVGAADPTGSVAAAAGAALALAVAVAGAPVLLAPALVALLLVAATVPRRRWRVLLVPLPALALLAPFLLEVVDRGAAGVRMLVAEPGLPVAAEPAASWQQLLGLPVAGDGLVPDGLTGAVATAWPLALGAVVGALALLALVRGAAVARGVRVAWLVTAAGLATAVAAAQVPVTVADGGVGPAWVGAPVSLALLGLLTAAVLGADRLRERLARWSFGWRQVAAFAVAVVAVVAAVGSLASWAWTSPSALRASDRFVVPAVAQQTQNGPDASRVLLLAAAEPGVAWTLLRADGTQLVDSSVAVASRALTGDLTAPGVAEPDEAGTEVASLAARLYAGAGGDVAGELAGLAVASVLVPPVADPADQAGVAARALLVGRLDATAGLERVTSNETGTLWRVRATSEDGTAPPVVVAAWARLVTSGMDVDDPTTPVTAVPATGSTVDADIAGGGAARVLVLAERADPGWHATLDGRPLRAVQDGWRQTFAVGEAGGHLEVWYDAPLRTGWLWLVLGVFGLTGLLALPLRRRRAGRS